MYCSPITVRYAAEEWGEVRHILNVFGNLEFYGADIDRARNGHAEDRYSLGVALRDSDAMYRPISMVDHDHVAMSYSFARATRFRFAARAELAASSGEMSPSSKTCQEVINHVYNQATRTA